MAGSSPGGLSLALLDRRHLRKGFSSGDVRVDAWLIHKALGAMAKHTSTTRVLVDKTEAVRGYYTLAHTALDVSFVPVELFGGHAPRHAPPMLTLAWIGVDDTVRGRGIGTWLFARALGDCAEAYDQVRFVAVIVDALSEHNARFYREHGFLALPGTTNKLYLPATTLMRVVRG